MKIPVNKGNGKSEVDARGPALDVDHELPAGEPGSPEASSSAPVAPESELQKLQAERDLLFDRLARQQAEFDNYRKRSTREQQEFRQYAVSDALKQFLPVLDSFDRALATPSSAEDSKLREGVELVRKQMLDTLARLGVTPIEAEGAAFDPQVHEAIEMVETRDAKDNHVITELQRGYRLKDRLLRPAMVRVAKNPGK